MTVMKKNLRAIAKIALDTPTGPGRGKLLRAVRTALEWDEEERKRLRRDNEDGFLMVPEGAKVGVHLNLHKHPYFNIKQPRRPHGRSDFPSETLGHVRALKLTKVEFYVGITGSRKTAVGGGSKTPYGGPVGILSAVEGTDNDFGAVPKSVGSKAGFNPKDFPAWRSLFFCRNDDVPVSGASAVVMRDWKVGASGFTDMSEDEIDWYLDQIGLTRADVGSGSRMASFVERRVAYTPAFWDDPASVGLRNDLIRIAFQHPELRPKLLPLF